MSSHTYLQAVVKNTSSYALLSGSANVFLDNNFVAKVCSIKFGCKLIIKLKAVAHVAVRPSVLDTVKQNNNNKVVLLMEIGANTTELQLNNLNRTVTAG